VKLANQSEIDTFLADAYLDESIYPYLTISKYVNEWKELKSDWEGINITDERLSYLGKISFDRGKGEIEMNICLYCRTPFVAGRAIHAIKYLINRYKPRAINSVVHSTNVKSLKIHKHIYGEPWGIEPGSAWDSKEGRFVDLYYFRKILKP
jgi:hypothetical protein